MNTTGGAKIITQIYEIQEPGEAEAVISLGVDHVGSVLPSKDQWKMAGVKAAGLVSKQAGVRQSLIPLFKDRETLFRAVEYYEPDLIHFCDTLFYDKAKRASWDDHIDKQTSLKNRFPQLACMRSVPVFPTAVEMDESVFDLLAAFAPVSDYFLVDTWSDDLPEAGFIGITGCSCNWDTAAELVNATPVPVILAGGLSPENVYHAIERVRPCGVDSCTMTNRRDRDGNIVRFKKDLERVKSFVEAVRMAERDLQQ